MNNCDTNISLRVDNTSFNMQLCNNNSLKPKINTSINPIKDYNKLINRPQINSILLENNVQLTDLNLRPIYYNTTNGWNNWPQLISEEGAIYIYSDYKVFENNSEVVVIPGIKIGDGLAYIIDLPFINNDQTETISTLSGVVNEHIADTNIHTNLNEKSVWNSKVTTMLNPNDLEELIFMN